MRIGVPLQEPSGPDPMSGLREQVQRAADDGFASVWLSNIFGLDALTALAVVGNQVGGIELGSAVVPTYPRHPAALAQQALTSAAACGGGRLVLGIGVSHKIVIEDMYGYDFGQPVRHMREYLAVLLPLLERRQASFTGATVRANIGLTVPGEGRPADRRHDLVDDRARHRAGPRRAGHYRGGGRRRAACPEGRLPPAGLCHQRPGRRA
jgi:alkanesulfonate monooxygenase SsuD/methylene tetrahydromethanopterin reductase-like flavin-dependent oxidoreductase (luciferase family)